jgi:hypothetical protein
MAKYVQTPIFAKSKVGMYSFYSGKHRLKILATFAIFDKLPKVNNRSLGAISEPSFYDEDL